MRYSRQQILSTYFSLLSALLLVVVAQYEDAVSPVPVSHTSGGSIAASISWDLHRAANDTFEQRIARRLRNRLYARGMPSPSLAKLTSGVVKRQALLKRKASVSFLHDDGSELHIWEVSPQRYPLWITSVITSRDADYVLNMDKISETIQHTIDPLVTKPVDITLTEVLIEEKVSRVVTTDTAKPGEVLHIDEAASSIAKTLEHGLSETSILLKKRDGIIVNATDVDLGKLELLSTGRSNFAGSTWSRSFNVRKAFREHVNNTLVAPGSDFSFNSTLNGRVTLGNGWVMAKVIVNGQDLELQPGGGICQASTTVYRAILNAGFPVLERRSHSLYVSYYKEYGVGIDATIYPGSQDLVFTNDTDNYLLVQSYDDGYEATVNIYGTSDGRSVVLDGPYFFSNAPNSLLVNGRKIAKNEIVWIQHVMHKGGRIEENMVISRYKTLPSSAEYAYLQ